MYMCLCACMHVFYGHIEKPMANKIWHPYIKIGFFKLHKSILPSILMGVHNVLFIVNTYCFFY